MDGLELRFSSRDVWIELKRTEDIIHDSNVQIELIFRIRVFPPGTGFNTFLDSSLKLDSENTIMSTTTMHYSEDVGRE